MQRTTNLDLPIFEQNDRPTWLVDVNDAMRKIDTGYGENVGQAGQAIAIANEAKTTAESAAASATNAVQTATAANTTANGALTAANRADLNASNAYTTAQAAQTAAGNAATAAAGAQSTAEATQTTANNAAVKANTALAMAQNAAVEHKIQLRSGSRTYKQILDELITQITTQGLDLANISNGRLLVRSDDEDPTGTYPTMYTFIFRLEEIHKSQPITLTFTRKEWSSATMERTYVLHATDYTGGSVAIRIDKSASATTFYTCSNDAPSGPVPIQTCEFIYQLRIN